jgi:hypothetical protein
VGCQDKNNASSGGRGLFPLQYSLKYRVALGYADSVYGPGYKIREEISGRALTGKSGSKEKIVKNMIPSWGLYLKLRYISSTE